MRPAAIPFPDLAALADGLTAALHDGGPTGSRVSVLNRKPLLPAMTFPSEVVTCRLREGNELRLFCKYAAGRNHNAHGHRGGVSYEAAIYEGLLQDLPVRTPKFYGAFRNARASQTWLILGFLDGGKLLRDVHLDLEKKPQPTAIGLAARWIGRFHALTAARLTQWPLPVLNRYTPAYYRGWAERTCRFAGKLNRQYPWLEPLCRRAGELFDLLQAAPQVVIHGEYYENNIVVCGRRIYPTDWESAAIAPGEIDLAALTDGSWRAGLVRQCMTEYKRARWPEGAPGSFQSTLEAARIYLHFRWLGERPEWSVRQSARWRFEELRCAAERLGLT